MPTKLELQRREALYAQALSLSKEAVEELVEIVKSLEQSYELQVRANEELAQLVSELEGKYAEAVEIAEGWRQKVIEITGPDNIPSLQSE